ncbi:DUF1592 domain-containing protein [Rubinisphaera margarita]|uniref:DUF1592 domain-containing protein n=1 Tax=Rubinisphaera margarita TaxID=2909586 RepID=UPI001EE8BAAC|nr:DUF1592 domain-containing protein [Rubinisphaera margarita]MCG6156997.1 DUF1592 domain-containing protein [Rubinisphaera margarita]
MRCGFLTFLNTTRRFRFPQILSLVATTTALSGLSPVYAQHASISKFTQNQCLDCHTGKESEAGFDLSALGTDLSDHATYERWVQVFDRVEAGEMPPKDYAEVPQKESKAFLGQVSSWLTKAREEQVAHEGRVRGRRLNNLQLERSLHDLLGIDIPLAVRFPEEQRTEGFTTVAEGQTMSHFQLEKHLNVVDLALDEAFRKALFEDDRPLQKLDADKIVRRNPKSRTREPELIDGLAVTWSGGVTFYGRIPATTAPKDGWYRFKVRAKALKIPENREGIWCTVRSGRQISSSPIQKWVGAFEATDEIQEWTYETWLEKGDMLEIRPGDVTLKKARFAGGQVGTGEGGPQDVPGIAIESIEMQKIFRDYSPDDARRLVIGKLGREWDKKAKQHRLVTENPEGDLTELLHRFAERAFRRPVAVEEIQPYIDLARQSLGQSDDLILALRHGYRALLCSPKFLYLPEDPGQLDDYEIASRLSYFLWNSVPDETLLKLAEQKKLSQPEILDQQVDRMLADRRGREFVRDFTADWLDLSQIDFTEPDRRLYPEFDVIVQQSMVEETVAFVQNMLDKNLSVKHLIDSDHTYLNSRLARFYEIDRELSDELVPVNLKAEDNRGGLITQGAILKVTANGTTTSPVIRGVWISERILGIPVPPVPAGVPAIEPDIRGATTIREMLEKHKSDASCASCHVKIDPPGFALENYDPAGQWRDAYPKGQKGKRVPGTPVNSGDELPDGRAFKNLEEFQELIASDPEGLARNVAEKFITCGTGAAIDFVDRDEIEAIVASTADDNYGLRSILKASITSSLFVTK